MLYIWLVDTLKIKNEPFKERQKMQKLHEIQSAEKLGFAKV